MILGVISFIIGVLCGIFIMCLLQASKGKN